MDTRDQHPVVSAPMRRTVRAEAQVNGEWREVVKGAVVGHKKIDRFEPVESGRWRFRCIKSNGPVSISKFAVSSVGAK